MHENALPREGYREYLQQLRHQAPKIEQGQVHVYTGDGKGKTSAALGVSIRALGAGWRVAFLQFIKGNWKSAEQNVVPLFGEQWLYRKLGRGFTWDHESVEEDIEAARQAWTEALRVLHSGDYELVVLDEINYVLSYGFLSAEEVLAGLKERPRGVHVICTGRGAPQALIDYADLVTEMRKVKHPFDRGILAQRGLDF